MNIEDVSVVDPYCWTFDKKLGGNALGTVAEPITGVEVPNETIKLSSRLNLCQRPWPC